MESKMRRTRAQTTFRRDFASSPPISYGGSNVTFGDLERIFFRPHLRRFFPHSPKGVATLPFFRGRSEIFQRGCFFREVICTLHFEISNTVKTRPLSALISPVTRLLGPLSRSMTPTKINGLAIGTRRWNNESLSLRFLNFRSTLLRHSYRSSLRQISSDDLVRGCRGILWPVERSILRHVLLSLGCLNSQRRFLPRPPGSSSFVRFFNSASST